MPCVTGPTNNDVIMAGMILIFLLGLVFLIYKSYKNIE